MSTARTSCSELISTRFPHDLAAQLRELAKHRQAAVSAVIVEAVAETVRKESVRPAEQAPVQAV